jgi:hypothetical protein
MTKEFKYFSQKKYYAKGFPEKPMTMEDFFKKAKKCSLLAVKPFLEDKIESLTYSVENLKSQEDVQRLIKLLY